MRPPLVAPENVQTLVLTDRPVHSLTVTALAANGSVELRGGLTHSEAAIRGHRHLRTGQFLGNFFPSAAEAGDAWPWSPILPSGPDQRFCLISELQKSTYPSL